MSITLKKYSVEWFDSSSWQWTYEYIIAENESQVVTFVDNITYRCYRYKPHRKTMDQEDSLTIHFVCDVTVPFLVH